MSTSRRRSLLDRNKRSGAERGDSEVIEALDSIEALEALEALEASEDSDLDEVDYADEHEDLEVVEDTLRSGRPGLFDEYGPTMDSAVMDELTDELPDGGLWLDRPGAANKLGKKSLLDSLDPQEYEPTEPGLPYEDLLPPPQQRMLDSDFDPTLPGPYSIDADSDDTEPMLRPQGKPRRMLDPAAVETLREVEAEKKALVEERTLAQVTPWLAAMGLSVGLAFAGLVAVIGLFLLFGRGEPFDPGGADGLPPQPALSAPVAAEDGFDEPEVEPVEEELPEEVVEEVAPAPRPRPRPRPEPEAVAVEEPVPVEPAPAPAPIPAPSEVGPDPESSPKKGLFRKKK